jgi:hypothetical protein
VAWIKCIKDNESRSSFSDNNTGIMPNHGSRIGKRYSAYVSSLSVIHTRGRDDYHPMLVDTHISLGVQIETKE